tara:strand:+ start:131 stop:346 length:216 start_codon:yes stop_codon:yes gene_type:complete
MKDLKKTSTGLHINKKGKRIEVYTPNEMESLRDKIDEMESLKYKKDESDIVIALTLSVLLITIGILIGMSI